MTRPMPAPTSSARVRWFGSGVGAFKGRRADGTVRRSGRICRRNCREPRVSTLGKDYQKSAVSVVLSPPRENINRRVH